MVMYLNLHMGLEQKRQKAENSPDESEIGPRVRPYLCIQSHSCQYIINILLMYKKRFLWMAWVKMVSTHSAVSRVITLRNVLGQQSLHSQHLPYMHSVHVPPSMPPKSTGMYWVNC